MRLKASSSGRTDSRRPRRINADGLRRRRRQAPPGDELFTERFNCKEASRLISSGLDQDLSPAEHAALRLHLAVCDACNKVKAQLVFLRRALFAYSGRGTDRNDPPAT